MNDEQVYLSAPQVRKRYGVTDTSLWRWLKDDRLEFPKPIYITKYRYWRLADLEKWEAGRHALAS